MQSVETRDLPDSHNIAPEGGASSALLAEPANAVAIARARAELAAHQRIFRAFEAHAARCVAGGGFLEAVGWAHIAGFYGWASPGGMLIAPVLERLLSELGKKHVPGDQHARIPSGDPRRVLHVMTECYDVGGHTRVVERWIERDTSRRATVMLLSQHKPVPEAFTAALARCGATVVRSADGDTFARARELRAVAAEHDLVVMHVHMHEVVPALAFADPVGRPPTIHFEHAAHQLWLGAGAADVVACFREVERDVAAARRGLGGERTRLLPLPVSPRPIPERGESRRSLGLDDRAQVVLSVVSPWKIRPVLAPTFPELVAEAAASAPQARFFVAGPAAGAEWNSVVERFGDRVKVLGPVPDLGPLLASADVFLDSWPATGGATLLDVAAAALPILTLGDASPDMALVRPNDRALDGGLVRARSAADLGRKLVRLLDSPAERASLGEALRAAARARHSDEWTTYLEEVVRAACERRGLAVPPPAPPPARPTSWECVLRLLYDVDGLSTTIAIMNNVTALPAEARPLDDIVADQLAKAIIAAAGTGRRVLAKPAVYPDAVIDVVERMRLLWAAGEVDGCIVALPPEGFRDGVTLLQRALDLGGDLEIDVVPAASLDEIAGPDDIVL